MRDKCRHHSSSSVEVQGMVLKPSVGILCTLLLKDIKLTQYTFIQFHANKTRLHGYAFFVENHRHKYKFPISVIPQGDKHIATYLKSRIIGQDHVIEAISEKLLFENTYAAKLPEVRAVYDGLPRAICLTMIIIDKYMSIKCIY